MLSKLKISDADANLTEQPITMPRKRPKPTSARRAVRERPVRHATLLPCALSENFDDGGQVERASHDSFAAIVESNSSQEDRERQASGVTHSTVALSESSGTEPVGGGLSRDETHHRAAASELIDGDDHKVSADLKLGVVAIDPIIGNIIDAWRLRRRWHKAEKSLILQSKAFCRAFTNGDKDVATKMFDQAADGKCDNLAVSTGLDPFLTSIESFHVKRMAVENDLRKLAHSLPVWSWVAAQRGFGDLNLAALVGECGDIGSYKSVSALWKRMGLAVFDGGRQRRVTNPELAEIHGYNPERRAVAWCLGFSLRNGNRDGPYRSLYLERKEIEAVKPEVKTKAHAANRAGRYMTKRVLRDLYSAWRTASTPAQSLRPTPGAMLDPTT